MNRATIRVVAVDGEYLGRLEHVVGQHGGDHATGLVVEREGDLWLLPLEAVRRTEGDMVVLRGPAEHYRGLRPFRRSGWRIIDEEIQAAELGIDEDFQIGSDEDDGGPGPFRAGAREDNGEAVVG